MNQQTLIIVIAVILGFIAYSACSRSRDQHSQKGTNLSRKTKEDLFPKATVANDKLVLVEGATENEIKQILQDFCNSYNKGDQFDVLPRLVTISDKQFAITFPYDIQFDLFCFFINYASYPMNFDKQFKTTGWATTKHTDTWITSKSANKPVMLYLSDFDTEYDNVFLTTNDNIGYKLGFAMGEEKQLLDKPEKNYVQQPITASDLENKPHTDFN